MNDYLYKPEIEGSDCLNATLGVKFSKDIFLLESFLKQHNIKYEKSDLENTPFGLAIRIKM